MRKFILAAAIAATSLSAIPAGAQTNPNREYNREVRDARQDYRRDLRNADDWRDVRDARRDYREEVRDARRDRNRDWRQYRNYDYNRFENGQRYYYADRYYRPGNYQVRRLGRNDRIYRGSDNRYYCRRSDGTTGLIIGGLAGGLLGNSLSSGGSRTLGTLLGGGAGALLGQSIDRGQIQCR
ncbi:glycine zipper 2TM domain-containing protein [Sphingomonas sp. MMS24-J45]|uniref:glycine zipper 2TM domain-containing protein n=1 Tax=Sphingomonas sp. MMS24-J45 TaxID=3238806 RepID=UPI0038511B0D